MDLRFHSSIHDIPAKQWNALSGIDYPFLRHEFLAALEDSHCTGGKSGWDAQHIGVYDRQQLIAVMPMFLKTHSYGEYVFDWSWASAYQRYGVAYYPKLVSAIPFTPAWGPRLASNPEVNRLEIMDVIANSLSNRLSCGEVSSAHVLFCDADDCAAWEQRGGMQRLGVQYHWFNNNYRDFDDFLAEFASRKRKNLRKERQKVLEQGLTLRTLEGTEIDAECWRRFYYFYRTTYAKRSGHGGYLSQDFFIKIGHTLPEHIVMVLAEHEGETVAGALNFRSSNTLYGRYWGCTREFDQLHFEACYYQGIEYCIKHGLQRFDPGAQGEHKIQRGFQPTDTWSNHWIADPQFRDAIRNFCEEESRQLQEYKKDAASYLPFKQES